MGKDYDTRRKWNQMYHFPATEKYTYLIVLLILFIKKTHFRRKLHLLANMKEEIQSV